MKEQLEQAMIFNAGASFNWFLDRKILHKNKTKFSEVYSRNNLPRLKNRVYVINLNQYKSIETHWIALYVNDDNVTYFALELNIFQKKLKSS